MEPHHKSRTVSLEGIGSVIVTESPLLSIKPATGACVIGKLQENNCNHAEKYEHAGRIYPGHSVCVRLPDSSQDQTTPEWTQHAILRVLLTKIIWEHHIPLYSLLKRYISLKPRCFTVVA
jgi:hypothetical protein